MNEELLNIAKRIRKSMYHRVQKPVRTYWINVLGLNTSSAYATMKLSDDNIITEFNANEPLMIASITKLMTMVVSSDHLEDYSKHVSVVASDIIDSRPNFLMEHDVITYKDLFACAAVISDNNAPEVLARVVGYKINPSAANDKEAKSAFIHKMNKKAASLGMDKTSYTAAWNWGMSSAKDQVKLLKHIQQKVEPIKYVWGLLSYTVAVKGVNHRSYCIKSKIERNFVPELIGGKTGTWKKIGSLAFIWRNILDQELYATTSLQSKVGHDRYRDVRIIIDEVYNCQVKN